MSRREERLDEGLPGTPHGGPTSLSYAWAAVPASLQAACWSGDGGVDGGWAWGSVGPGSEGRRVFARPCVIARVSCLYSSVRKKGIWETRRPLEVGEGLRRKRGERQGEPVEGAR